MIGIKETEHCQQDFVPIVVKQACGTLPVKASTVQGEGLEIFLNPEKSCPLGVPVVGSTPLKCLGAEGSLDGSCQAVLIFSSLSGTHPLACTAPATQDPTEPSGLGLF